MKYKTLTPIQIGAHPISIEIVDAFTTHDDTCNAGDACPSTDVIRIALRTTGGGYRPEAIITANLIHELLHKIEHIYSIKVEDDDVDRFAQGLLQILKQYGIKLIE